MQHDLILFVGSLIAGWFLRFAYQHRERLAVVWRERITRRVLGLAFAVCASLAFMAPLQGCTPAQGDALRPHAGRASALIRALCGLAPAITPALDRFADGGTGAPPPAPPPADPPPLDAGTLPASGGEQ